MKKCLRGPATAATLVGLTTSKGTTMSCDDNERDDEGCNHCTVEHCTNHPTFQETMRQVRAKLESYVTTNREIRRALRMFEEHTNVSVVLADLFSTRLPPTTLVNFSFKVEVPLGTLGVKVFQVDRFEIPVAGLWRILDPLLRTCLTIVNDFSDRLANTAFMMHVTDQIREMVQQEHEKEPEPSELN